MGVGNFLKIKELNIRKQIDLIDLKGSTAVVDISTWIHRASTPQTVVSTCMGLASIFINNGIRITFIFDGKEPEAKSEVVAKRRKKRADMRSKGEELMTAGKTDEAKKAFAQCMERTETVTNQLKNACKVSGIEFIVSPAEADAQIAHMIQAKKADLVTEDADLIVYNCPRILFKLTRNGKGDLYERDRVMFSKSDPFHLPSVRTMAIAIGTDYWYHGIHQIGIKRATNMYKKLAPNLDMKAMKNYLLKTHSIRLDSSKEIQFQRAENTFLHQLVYDVDAKKIIPLTPYPAGMTQNNFPYAGKATIKDVEHWIPPTKTNISLQFQLTTLPELYTCSYCTEVFNLEKDRDAHKESEHSTKCELCGKVFARLAELKVHKLSHSTEKTFSCNKCDATFNQPGSLKRHHDGAHSNDKPFKCEICDKGFTRTDSLKSHKKVHSEERPYKCQICQKKFKSRNTLKDHNRVHSSERQFVCDVCSKDYKSTSELKRHKSTHSNEKTFVCGQCNKPFSLKQHLIMHQLTHSTEKKHVCKQCGKAYKKASSLKMHENEHKGLLPYRCDKCSAKYAWESALLTHRKRRHEKNN